MKKILKAIKRWNAYWAFIEQERIKAMIYCGRGFFILALSLMLNGCTGTWYVSSHPQYEKPYVHTYYTPYVPYVYKPLVIVHTHKPHHNHHHNRPKQTRKHYGHRRH